MRSLRIRLRELAEQRRRWGSQPTEPLPPLYRAKPTTHSFATIGIIAGSMSGIYVQMFAENTLTAHACGA
jgi:hypothetical protein